MVPAKFYDALHLIRITWGECCRYVHYRTGARVKFLAMLVFGSKTSHHMIYLPLSEIFVA